MKPTTTDGGEVTTYYDQPLLKQPVWIWTVPAYLYVGGLAGAALVLGAAAQLNQDWRLRRLVRASRWLGFIGQGIGSIFLIMDLGRPGRFLNMLRVFRPTSPLSIGSWILAAGTPLAGMSALLADRKAGRKIGDASGIGAGLLGIPLAGYTGVLLSNTAVPVWSRARHSLPALFVASSIASCASAFEMMELTPREARIVHRFGAIGMAGELLSMTAVEAQTGIGGVLWQASKVLTVAGLVVTLMPGQSKTKRVAGLLGTLGGLALRFAVYRAGFKSARDAT